MRHKPVRAVLTNTIAIAAAGALALGPAPLPAQRAPTVRSEVSLAAAMTTPSVAPPGALLQQFLANQVENCSLICPFIVSGAVQAVGNFVVLPLTLVQLLQTGEPLLNAIADSDATVSTAVNDALTGIIDNDLNKVLPRAQNALEVAVVGLIDIGTTAVTQPLNLLPEINSARTNLLDALKQPPGTMPPPPVHNAFEAFAVRGIEVLSALTFQAPERLLLGLSQAANALFTTVGDTGDVGQGLTAAGASLTTAFNDAMAFVNHAFTEPIPIASATIAPTKTAPGTRTPPTSAPAASALAKSDPNAGKHDLRLATTATTTAPSALVIKKGPQAPRMSSLASRPTARVSPGAGGQTGPPAVPSLTHKSDRATNKHSR